MSLYSLPDPSWHDQEISQEAHAEFAEHERAIASHKEALKASEAELLDMASALNKSAADINKENEALNAATDERVALAEARRANRVDINDLEAARQLTLMGNAEWVSGGTSGNYTDYNPYTGGGSVHRHNEGGVTQGSYRYDLDARKLHPYARARGDGVGITDDNDVTTYAHFNFWFLAGRIGHVRALVPYRASGNFDIYANDKWYNSKEAKLNLSIRLRLYQHGTTVKTDFVSDTIFSLADDNINSDGRIDRSGSLYSPSLAVGANRWARALVQVRAHVETEGGGSSAILDFRKPDYIRVPYVRFDFS